MNESFLTNQTLYCPIDNLFTVYDNTIKKYYWESNYCATIPTRETYWLLNPKKSFK